MFRDKKNLEILKKALAVIAEEEAAKLPSEEECAHITFSEEFERKMEKLIRFQKKSYYYLINTVGKRVACIILAILITFTTVTFSVKALREAVIEFFVETFEKFSIIGFNEEDLDNSLDHIETYYAPTYIPDGYELESDEKLITYRNQIYKKENYHIYFRQGFLHTYSTYFDTENSIIQELTVQGQKVLYTTKGNEFLLCWNDQDYFYLLQTNENIDIEEIVKIAELTKPE